MRNRRIVSTCRLATGGVVSISAIALLVASCGAASTGSGLSADADSAALIEAFAPCDSDAEFVPPAEFLVSSADRWLRVTRIVDRPDDAWEDGGQVDLEAVPFGGSEPAIESVLMWREHADGVEWAIASGAEPWVVMPPPEALFIDGLIGFTMVVPDDTAPFFAGPCAFDFIQGPLERMLGDRSEETLRAIVGKTGDDLAGLLGLPLSTDTVPPVDPDLQVLNPQDAPAELLDSLRTASVQYLLDVPLGDEYTICSRIAAGWNDCFVPDDKSASRGYGMGVYLDETGVLEVWLMDRSANLANPIQLLGTIQVPATLADLDSLAMRVELEVASLERPVVTLVEAIPGDQLDFTDPEWSAYNPQPPGTATTSTP